MRVGSVAARAAVLSFVFALTLAGQSYTFRYYVATQGGPGRTDATGSAARFWNPQSVATDASGNVYVADLDNKVIRMIAPGGSVTTVAGVAGVSGTADGFRSVARFDRPAGLAIDPTGNLYVSDAAQHTIRKITPGGLVTTFAGKAGLSGHVDATGGAARFSFPSGIACDNDGNVYVADYGTHTIRRITPGAVVSTLAGLSDNPGSNDGTGSAARFNRPLGVAADGSDNVYVADWLNHTIRRITPSGVVTTIAGAAGLSGYVDATGATARFAYPRNLVVGLSNTLYVADSSNYRVRKIDLGSGSVTTYAGSGQVESVDGTGTAASFAGVQAVATDAADNVYVAEWIGHTIRKIAPGAIVTTYAGMAAAIGDSTDSGAAARFNYPEDVAVDSSGNIFIANSQTGTIRKIPSGTLQPIVFAGSTGSYGPDDGTGTAARFVRPSGLTMDAAGNIYVADRQAQMIRKITSAGEVTTIAGAYMEIGSNDGTGTAARFYEPNDVAVDGSSNVYVADRYNHTIRKITPAGVVTTLAGMAGFPGSTNATGSAARFNEPASITFASDGNLYVADRANLVIRKVTTAGVVTTVAGSAGLDGGVDGTGAAARFSYPARIASDANGNLYVADGSYTVRRVTTGGVVTTLGGVFNMKGSEDGTGSVTRFSELKGLASTPDGVLFIIDAQTLRRGAPALNAVATIDQTSGPVGVARQLSTTGSATSWDWKVVRRPPGSSAVLSASNNPSPTFTPDAPDLFVFRLSAGAGVSSSVTEVSLLGAADPTLTLGPTLLPRPVRNLDYSVSIVASGGTLPYLYDYDGALPAGLTFDSNGLLSGRPTVSGSFSFQVEVIDSNGAVGSRTFTLQVDDAAPYAVAQATTPTSVTVTWPAAQAGAAYRIYRSAGAGYSFLGERSFANSSYVDATVLANTAYLYRVTVRDAAGHESSPGAHDLATTVIFTDPTLVPGVTPVRHVHVEQLRTAVNAVRTLATMGQAVFTDGSLTGMPVRAIHISELRNALDPARMTLLLGSTAYPDDPLIPDTTNIRKVHIEGLRLGVE